MKDWFAILGVSVDDVTKNPELVKRQYRKLALELHPDKKGSADEFKRLARAYQILSDASLRTVISIVGHVEEPEEWVQQATLMFPGMELETALELLKVLTPDRSSEGADLSSMSAHELGELCRRPGRSERVWIKVIFLVTYLAWIIHLVVAD
jgi:curved DNA-binding protein CbpA